MGSVGILLLFFVSAWAGPAGRLVSQKNSQPEEALDIVDEPDHVLLSEDVGDESNDVMVAQGVGGGYSHIKAARQDFSNLAAALKESLENELAKNAEEEVSIATLQEQLNVIEPGAEVDRTTPKDGSCLFHALKKGGLTAILPADVTPTCLITSCSPPNGSIRLCMVFVWFYVVPQGFVRLYIVLLGSVQSCTVLNDPV